MPSLPTGRVGKRRHRPARKTGYAQEALACGAGENPCTATALPLIASGGGIGHDRTWAERL
jgi:hypothetical protein